MEERPQTDSSQAPQPAPSAYPEPPAEEQQSSWLQRIASPQGILLVAVISLALLAASVIGGWLLLGRAGVSGNQQSPPTSELSLDALSTEYPELAGILQDPKLDSVYKDFLLAYQEGGADAALEMAEKRGLLNANGDLRLTLELDTADTTALQAELEANGIQVTAVSGNLMDVAIPMQLLESMVDAGSPGDLLESITNLNHVVRIRLPKVGISDAGNIETESLGMIAAYVWQSAGITGKGIKVGVLDLGFNQYRDLLGSDLPANVTVRSFITGVEADQSSTPHGTAVAEIIHDIAPDAELFFAAYETDVEERQAVEWLISQGVRIISHSAGSIYGPMDGSTDEALWVDSVVDGGILWVNSAGNTGYTHYRATFTDNDGDGYHEFSPGDEMMGFTPDGNVVMVVNWDDWNVGSQDLDMYVFDPDGNEIASSTNVQDGPEDDAAEGVVYAFPDDRTYYMAIYGDKVTRPIVMDFFLRDGLIEYYTPEHSVTTPGDSRRALTVGAVNWSDDALEDYSSRGPTNDGRLKPEIAAPAGISSAAYGTTWIGTSASAPHVSGAAALVLQVYPNYTPDQVRDFLLSRSLDLGSTGPDNEFGYGRLYLGGAPDLSAVIIATPTALPTATLPVQGGISPGVSTPTSTPERRELPTPVASDDSGSSFGLVMGLLVCVVIPAVLGMGGIGLVGGVWYITRRRGPTYPPHRQPLPRPHGQREAQSPGHEPARPHIDNQNVCPRCGSAHRPNARFCPVCGLALASDLYREANRPLAGEHLAGTPHNVSPPDAGVEPSPPSSFCNQCGMPLQPESKFCPNCGAPKGST